MMSVTDAASLILYDEHGLLAVNKPAGCETISTTGGVCLTTALKKQLGLTGLEPAHRLDRDTTGVQLFARNRQTLATLEGLFRERRTTKNYLALCNGIPFNPEGSIKRNLSKWGGGHRPVQVVKGNEGLEAQTDYQLLARNPDENASLILFHPLQGRTHQIRVHASAFGRPIIGDDQYGDREVNARFKALCGISRQALHAWRLSLPLPDLEMPLLIEAPVPDDMCAAFDALFPDWRQIQAL